MRKVLFFTTVFCVCVFAKKNAEITAVTTSIPALAALAKEILKDTPIEIIEPFGNEISIDELDQVAKNYEARLDEISKKNCGGRGYLFGNRGRPAFCANEA